MDYFFLTISRTLRFINDRYMKKTQFSYVTQVSNANIDKATIITVCHCSRNIDQTPIIHNIDRIIDTQNVNQFHIRCHTS